MYRSIKTQSFSFAFFAYAQKRKRVRSDIKIASMLTHKQLTHTFLLCVSILNNNLPRKKSCKLLPLLQL